QHHVESLDQVGRGVDQSAVQVENDGERGHAFRLSLKGQTPVERPAAFVMDIEAQKRQAAAQAVEWVRPGMRLGLGTGSTAKHFVELLAERVRGGLKVVGVPTSETTRKQAEQLGVPLTTLDETPELDMTVDGADEVGPDLTLIIGGGGALLREKIEFGRLVERGQRYAETRRLG